MMEYTVKPSDIKDNIFTAPIYLQNFKGHLNFPPNLGMVIIEEDVVILGCVYISSDTHVFIDGDAEIGGNLKVNQHASLNVEGDCLITFGGGVAGTFSSHTYRGEIIIPLM